jgi:integrase
MALTDSQCKNAKPQDKPYKLTDEKGLFLLIAVSGGRWWRFSYRFEHKQKTLSMGTYPDTSLRDARDKRDEARKLLAAGIDPGSNRKATKAAKAGEAANSFEIVAREWYEKQAPNWAPTHAEKIIRRLERDLFPWLGPRPINAIKAPAILEALRRIEERGAVDTAHRAQQNCGQIFRYAVATGRADHNPVPDLKGALPPVKQTHYAAVTNPKDIGELLRAIDGYQGFLVTKCALQLASLVFVRPGELRAAEWSEFDLEAREWNIPAERMKLREPHLVPL